MSELTACHNAGFSVTGLLVTLFVTSILIAFAMPSIHELRTRMLAYQETQYMTDTLNRLALRSLQSEKNIIVEVGERSYQGREGDSIILKQDLSRHTTIQSDPPTIAFYKNGSASPATIRIEDQSKRCEIFVSVRARIRFECGSLP